MSADGGNKQLEAEKEMDHDLQSSTPAWAEWLAGPYLRRTSSSTPATMVRVGMGTPRIS